jgi:hypothetical protein
MDASNNRTEQEIDIASALGATEQVSSQKLSLYIPNKDQYGKEFGMQRKWVLEAAELLAEIGGGFTIMPPVEGGWQNESGVIIWENPVLIYTYIRPDKFIAKLTELRKFLHRLGRETNQGEIVVEFDVKFYRITDFDQDREKENENN